MCTKQSSDNTNENINKQITLGDNKYTVISDSKYSNYPYLGLDDPDWKGPCVNCGGNCFTIYVPTLERKYQHFCSGGCAMCFDSREPQSENAKVACEAYLSRCLSKT